MPRKHPLTQKLEQLSARAEALQPVLLQKMGGLAMEFVDENFRRQGFQGAVFEPWTPRKSKKAKDQGRHILVQSGRLKNSTFFTVQGDSVIIRNPTPYARIHNEGGSITQPEREGVMNFGFRKNGKLKMQKIGTEAQRKKVKAQAKFTIYAHSFKMPQRRFIGYSPVLVNDVHLMIARELAKM